MIAGEYSGAVVCPIRSMMRVCMVASMLCLVSYDVCSEGQKFPTGEWTRAVVNL